MWHFKRLLYCTRMLRCGNLIQFFKSRETVIYMKNAVSCESVKNILLTIR